MTVYRKIRPVLAYNPRILDYELYLIGEIDDGTPEGKPCYFRLEAFALPLHGEAERLLGEGQFGARAFAQAFVDEAYRAGIHPGAEAAENDARRAHLADMRAIVFKKLGVDDPAG